MKARLDGLRFVWQKDCAQSNEQSETRLQLKLFHDLIKITKNTTEFVEIEFDNKKNSQQNRHVTFFF